MSAEAAHEVQQQSLLALVDLKPTCTSSESSSASKQNRPSLQYAFCHTIGATGFQEAKRKALTALQDGKVAYETREAKEKKNLLATGAITFAEAASIMGLPAATRPVALPHHMDEQLEVWVFRPADWYIKFYFLDDCIFVSFHKLGA